MEYESLEEVQAALDAEVIEWKKRGLSVDDLKLGAIAPMLLDLTSRVQALTNVLILKDIITEDEINYQFKLIMLNNMVTLRESAPDLQRDAIRKQILDGARIRMNGGKLPWEN